VDGILLDLGASSIQFDTPERGFSFLADGPLDMRFNPSNPLTAGEIVNRWPSDRLVTLFHEYGDQPFSRRIARAIMEARRRRPIRRTDELADLVASVVPAPGRRRRNRESTKWRTKWTTLYSVLRAPCSDRQSR
jgi:16S rRNA (cytosine1402-N4)-methyltransferase